MDYQKNSEEFYNLMAEKLEEIHSLSIPYEEKRELQYMVYETMANYIEIQNLKFKNSENFKKVGENLESLVKFVYQMRDGIESIQHNGRIALINAQIAAEKTREALIRLKETRKAVENNPKSLMKKLDVKNTLLEITQNMYHQRNNN